MFLDLFAVVFARVVWVGADCGEFDERRNDPSSVAPVGSTVICSGTKGGAMSRVERSGAYWSAEQKRSIVTEAFAPGAPFVKWRRAWMSFPVRPKLIRLLAARVVRDGSNIYRRWRPNGTLTEAVMPSAHASI